jgi:hypothetical protein
MGGSRLGCHGDWASSLISRVEAGKMPTFQDRLEACPTIFQTASKKGALSNGGAPIFWAVARELITPSERVEFCVV